MESRVPTVTRRVDRRLVIISFLVLLLGLGVTLALRVTLLRSNSVAQGFGAFDPVGAHNPDDPQAPLLLGGRQVSLEQAEANWGGRVPRPNHEAASDSSIQQVWVYTEGPPQVAIRYESGVRVYVSTWPPGKDPGQWYSDFVSDTGYGSAGQISGHPTLAIPEDAQAEGYPKATIFNLAIGRVEVELQGHMAVADLEAIARSVR